MSDVSQGPGWWEASDGKWYPPESPPGTADPVDDTAAADAGAGVVHRVLGTVMPVLEIDLQPGQTVIAQGGELSWITSSIASPPRPRVAVARKGLMSAVKRVVGGGTLFMTEFRAERTPGTVAFATKLPGEIRPVEVRPDRTYMVHRHGFLAGTADVELAIAFQQSFGAGLFGGTGFILQRVSGNGTAWIELSASSSSTTSRPARPCASTLATWACSTKASTSRSCRSRASRTWCSAPTASFSRAHRARHGVVAVPAAAQPGTRSQALPRRPRPEPDEQSAGFLSMLES